ncbi:unnamed protein product [Caenorhabditis angaria]|uniref:Granulins domain-containing protein n=1 Tax=Caenorhabditis angaria TaxID=860376 RepID=A0A9P1ISE9_9PELO|nr:unnamed protein product [Caenorhabditis angaria]
MRFAIFVFLVYFCRNADFEPNLCDKEMITQCDEYAVCCDIGKGQYGCCPFTNGICCPGFHTCCPSGFQCTDSGTCKRI